MTASASEPVPPPQNPERTNHPLELARSVCGLFLLQRIDQIDGGEEADLFAVMLNRLDAQSRRDVAFAGAWSADQYDVVALRALRHAS